MRGVVVRGLMEEFKKLVRLERDGAAVDEIRAAAPLACQVGLVFRCKAAAVQTVRDWLGLDSEPGALAQLATVRQRDNPAAPDLSASTRKVCLFNRIKTAFNDPPRFTRVAGSPTPPAWRTPGT